MFKPIRYGTPLSPTNMMRICAQFPLSERYPIVDPDTLEPGQRPFEEIKALSPRITSSELLAKTGHPSVSTFIGATENLTALYQWQLRQIQEFGMDGFKKNMFGRMASGRMFHSVAEEQLKELVEKGEIRSTVEETLSRVKNGEKYAKELIGYLKGIREFLRTLRVNPLIQLEQPIHHPLLCYTGRFDAIIEIE
jgi:hypothetical protein